MKFVSVAAAGLAAAALLSACSAGGSSSSATPSLCGNPSSMVLVYPAPGATAVPDGTSALYAAAPSPLPTGNQYDVDLQGPPAYGAQYTATFTHVAASAVPSPAASPGFANPVYYETQLAASLSSATTFAAYFNDQGSNCVPSASLGTFSTQ